VETVNGQIATPMVGHSAACFKQITGMTPQ
jgi:hypothetical protein